jgi:hypothetical protein
MKVFLVINSCLLTEYIVVGYPSAEEAVKAVRAQIRSGAYQCLDIESNYSVEEVIEPAIIEREIEEDDHV